MENSGYGWRTPNTCNFKTSGWPSPLFDFSLFNLLSHNKLLTSLDSHCLYSFYLHWIIPDKAIWRRAQSFSSGIDSKDPRPHGSSFSSFTEGFLNQGQIYPPGDIWQYLGTFLVATTEGRALLALLGRGQGCCSIPCNSTKQNYPAPKCPLYLRLRNWFPGILL